VDAAEAIAAVALELDGTAADGGGLGLDTVVGSVRVGVTATGRTAPESAVRDDEEDEEEEDEEEEEEAEEEDKGFVVSPRRCCCCAASCKASRMAVIAPVAGFAAIVGVDADGSTDVEAPTAGDVDGGDWRNRLLPVTKRGNRTTRRSRAPPLAFTPAATATASVDAPLAAPRLSPLAGIGRFATASGLVAAATGFGGDRMDDSAVVRTTRIDGCENTAGGGVDTTAGGDKRGADGAEPPESDEDDDDDCCEISRPSRQRRPSPYGTTKIGSPLIASRDSAKHTISELPGPRRLSISAGLNNSSRRSSSDRLSNGTKSIAARTRRSVSDSRVDHAALLGIDSLTDTPRSVISNAMQCKKHIENDKRFRRTDRKCRRCE
jgi:hypothetical protein